MPNSLKQRVFVYERMDPTDASLVWLEEQGISVVRGRAMWEAPYARYSDEDIIEAARGFQGVMGASGARFTENIIQSLPELQCISKLGVGFDNIDVDAASRRGILVSNTPEPGEAADVAEHTIATLLYLVKQLGRWTPEYMRRGGWRPGFFAQSLAGKTMGLVGYGHIAREVAARLTNWGVNILAYDPATAVPKEFARDLNSLLAESDVVSLHAAPTPTNRHLIGKTQLALMKRNSILINTARASLIQKEALIEALNSGHLFGAAIDVYDDEPPDPLDPLFELDNVVVTPHAAAWTYGGLQALGWHGARNIHAMLTGHGAVDLVNPAVRCHTTITNNGRE